MAESTRQADAALSAAADHKLTPDGMYRHTGEDRKSVV